MNRYPTAYRAGSEKYAEPKTQPMNRERLGFQKPRVVVPRSANDNMPFPANENDVLRELPPKNQKAFYRSAAETARRLDAAAFGRFVSRTALGPIGRAMDAYDIGSAVVDYVQDVFKKQTPTWQPRPAPHYDPRNWYQSNFGYPPSSQYPELVGYFEFDPDIAGPTSFSTRHDIPPNFIPSSVTEPWNMQVGQMIWEIWRGNFSASPAPNHLGEPASTTHYANNGFLGRYGNDIDPLNEQVMRESLVRVPRAATVPLSPAEWQWHDWNSVNEQPVANAAPPSGPSSRSRTENAVSVSTLGKAPRWHAKTKPTNRTKEIKMRTGQRTWQVVSVVLSSVTETVDLINALHDAIENVLPKDRFKPFEWGDDYKTGKMVKPNASATKAGYFQITRRVPDSKPPKFEKIWVQRYITPPQQKVREIYDNWDKIDWNKAFKNIVYNQIEDAVLGKAGQKLGEAAKKNRPHAELPFGYQLGPAL